MLKDFRSDEIQNEAGDDLIVRDDSPQLKDLLLENHQFQEYLQNLLDNPLVDHIKEQLILMNDEVVVRAYGKRKAAILITMLAGTVISFVGSLTFFSVAKQFPKEFGNFTGITVDNNIADGVGDFLGWTNVVIEAIFYTWTISNMLPEVQPDPKQKKPFNSNNVVDFYKCCDKFRFHLPSVMEWSLAIASTIPLTFLSLIEEEKMNKNEAWKYTIVSSIAIITLISNKYFLTLTHKQFKKIWSWARHNHKSNEIEQDLLNQVKKSFLEALIRGNEKLHRLSKEDFQNVIIALKEITQQPNDLESQYADAQLRKIFSIMFKDLSFPPKKTNKTAVVLIPTIAVFAALSWLGLIATVPQGVNEKISSSPTAQYLLMIIAGIPLIEIGLFTGGSVGLQLSNMGNGLDSLTNNLIGWETRLLGYIPLSLFGLFSFGTNATLTIQQFESMPVVTWMLLPSATLGIDLINIFACAELWDQVSTLIRTSLNNDNKLFIRYQNLLNFSIEEIKSTSKESLTAIFLKLEPEVQNRIKQFIPDSANQELYELTDELYKQLHSKLLEAQRREDMDNRSLAREKRTSRNLFFSYEKSNRKNSMVLEEPVPQKTKNIHGYKCCV